MPRFFVSKDAIRNGVVTVSGEDAHHISRALRMAAGERITVCNAEGTDYDCVLTDFLPDCVRARVETEKPSETEPPYVAVLYQGLPKGDKLEQVIQKAVECGVSRVVPFESERCVARIKEGDEEKKTTRRNRIAAEAAKQCGRGRLPAVESARPFKAVIDDAKRFDLALFCYEGEGTIPLPKVLHERKANLPANPSVAILIGSEGGFSEAEARAAQDAGWAPVGLGKRILRTETAPVFALAAISCALEL
ncbi:MAG: 16S rRNA (uracil(1498)-N(3))-methyltransferase [Clostridia bacterium]|nr:16S rRNA (uracil(1498)-N(3))-methyltransferase [Clostridia bacterium]